MATHLRMDSINRATSPMKMVEETLDLNRDEMSKRKRLMEADQKVRSPFLIGSIEGINQKISKLDQKLQNYRQLIAESRMSEASEPSSGFDKIDSARGREAYQQRERELREINQFAGIYAIKSTFTPGISDRVKNISKISMNPSASKVAIKKDSGKPKFVELHQYPGYDPAELTALPHDISAMTVFSKVSEAQTELRKKSGYLPEFERLLYSQMSRAILQDTFWWYFLEKYQSDKNTQAKLFNRIAHNYVKLMNYAREPKFKDVFLKDYPSLLAQSVYAAFCEAFPDSYRMFGAGFKEDLVHVIYDWITGLRPAPRSWMAWNMEKLEPAGIRNREDIMNQAKANNSKNEKKGGSSIINFDLVESATESQSTIHPGSSLSSLSSHQMPHSTKRNNSMYGRRSIAVNDTNFLAEERRRGSKSKRGMKSAVEETPLTPIIENSKNVLRDDVPKSFANLLHGPSKKKESHPVGKGPDFVRSAFNINGQSPLVAHFLKMKNLESEAGQIILVQRTELDNLPAVDAPTYRQLIRKSFQQVRDQEASYQSMIDAGAKSAGQFYKNLRKSNRDHILRENNLLSKPREVKRLADLIMLEKKKDQDSISAGAGSAVEEALLGQEY